MLCGLNWVLGSWFVLLPRKLERVMRGKDILEAQLTLLLYTPLVGLESMMSPPPPRHLRTYKGRRCQLDRVHWP